MLLVEMWLGKPGGHGTGRPATVYEVKSHRMSAGRGFRVGGCKSHMRLRRHTEWPTVKCSRKCE